jgi:hypothetical protein
MSKLYVSHMLELNYRPFLCCNGIARRVLHYSATDMHLLQTLQFYVQSGKLYRYRDSENDLHHQAVFIDQRTMYILQG